MSDKNKFSDPDEILGDPAVGDKHTRTYEIKDAERDSMTDDKSVKSEGAPAPEAEAECNEPAPAAAPIQSQAVLDIKEAGMTPEEAAAAFKALSEESGREGKKEKKSSRPENLATVAGFRWMLLLILSVASVAVWAVDSQFFSHRPYSALAWGLLAACLVLGILSFKIFRLPTRSGLAALCWSGTFFIDALYGPSPYMLSGVAQTSGGAGGAIPAVLPWAGLLTLIIIWVLVAIWRKVGRYAVIDIILGILLIYAALGVLWGPLNGILSSGALSMNFNMLAASPTFITDHLPWFLWPMTVMLFFILPLAAFFALWDQCSALRRKGGRHGGNFFLALAFIGLLPYGFLTYGPAASACPTLETSFRTILPSVAGTAVVSKTQEPPAPAAVKTPTPAETSVETPATAETAVPVEAPAAVETPAPTETAAPVETPAPVAETAPEPVKTPAPSAAPDSVETPAPATAAPEAPAVDPAVVSALEERLSETETRLRETESRLDETSGRLEKAESGLESAVSGLAEARKKIDELEKMIQTLSAPAPDLDDAIVRSIRSLGDASGGEVDPARIPSTE